MKPRIPITDSRFKYRNSDHTDVRKTWRRARLERQQNTPSTNVTTIKRKAA